MGTGSAIAHRAVDAVMGPRTLVHEHAGAPAAGASMEAAPAPAGAPEGPCGAQAKAFADCIQRSGGDMGACQPYLDLMQHVGGVCVRVCVSVRVRVCVCVCEGVCG